MQVKVSEVSRAFERLVDNNSVPFLVMQEVKLVGSVSHSAAKYKNILFSVNIGCIHTVTINISTHSAYNITNSMHNYPGRNQLNAPATV